MISFSHKILFLLRLVMGWFMFYAGITKILNPEWSAARFLADAKTFPEFYAWLARPDILPLTNILNEWGLTFLGVSLILGLFVRGSAILGAILMMLYYFPGLIFPYADHAYIIDEHIIYALLFLYFAAVDAGKAWGLDYILMRKNTY